MTVFKEVRVHNQRHEAARQKEVIPTRIFHQLLHSERWLAILWGETVCPWLSLAARILLINENSFVHSALQRLPGGLGKYIYLHLCLQTCRGASKLSGPWADDTLAGTLFFSLRMRHEQEYLFRSYIWSRGVRICLLAFWCTCWSPIADLISLSPMAWHNNLSKFTLPVSSQRILCGH